MKEKNKYQIGLDWIREYFIGCGCKKDKQSLKDLQELVDKETELLDKIEYLTNYCHTLESQLWKEVKNESSS